MGLPTAYVPIDSPRAKSQQTSVGRRIAQLAIGVIVVLTLAKSHADELDDVRWAVHKKLRRLPKDPLARAKALLKDTPLIDGHIDLPIFAREFYQNQVDEIDLQHLEGQVDIARMRRGGMGGFFHSVYIPCPEDIGLPADNDGNFTTAFHQVRDTLEQIDVAKLLIDKYSSNFDLSLTAKDWRRSMRRGKFGGQLGVEGGHQLGSSLAVLRQYYDLGVRYVTLTHSCNNALADTCGYTGYPVKPRWNGISPFGRIAIEEMNRLGMLVDVSHTSPKTASDALSISRAPPIFSHSNARGVFGRERNVPDSILRRIGRIGHETRSPVDLRLDGEKGLGWGNDTQEAEKDVLSGDTIIMLNFSPDFLAPGNSSTELVTVASVADMADYIGKLAGRQHVGIGSDFDGIENVPRGLDDVSYYPYLVAELIHRGWSDNEIEGLVQGNILRVMEKVEKVKFEMRHEKPRTDVFDGRDDMKRRTLPGHEL